MCLTGPGCDNLSVQVISVLPSTSIVQIIIASRPEIHRYSPRHLDPAPRNGVSQGATLHVGRELHSLRCKRPATQSTQILYERRAPYSYCSHGILTYSTAQVSDALLKLQKVPEGTAPRAGYLADLSKKSPAKLFSRTEI